MFNVKKLDNLSTKHLVKERVEMSFAPKWVKHFNTII